MDTVLLHCPSMSSKPKPKRPCSSISPDSPPASTSRAPKLDRRRMDADALLEAFLGLADSSTLSSLDRSFDRILESRARDSDQKDMIERALRLGSVLLEAGKRSARKRSTLHNAIVWALPPDLTIKVFSMLDTQSVCYAAATCSFFHKCAMDPMCYACIDLTTEVPKVNNLVLSTMIKRAGRALQSLRLGVVPGPTALPGSSQSLVYSFRNSTDASGFSWNDKRSRQGKESSILSRSCLTFLSGDSFSPGALLRRLHLYNIERLDTGALSAALSACPSLLDLEIAGLHVELRLTLEAVSNYCPLIERLYFESSKTGRDDSLKLPTCNDLVKNCPNLTSLSLRGFKLQDYKVRVLVKGFRRLKYVDFTTTYSITGAFLKNLGGNAGGGNLLEVLVLRDCMHLKEVEVERFLSAVLAGDFKLLRHLDISNREGLASERDWYRRCYNPSFICIKQLLEERPGLRLLAEFPSEGSFTDVEQMSGSDMESPVGSRQMSEGEGSPFTSSSLESSYNSDQGSANEDSGSLLIYEDSYDEVDFLPF